MATRIIPRSPNEIIVELQTSKKVKNVFIETLCLRIVQSKNHKDRITIFSEKLKDRLIGQMKNKAPDNYLFLTN